MIRIRPLCLAIAAAALLAPCAAFADAVAAPMPTATPIPPQMELFINKDMLYPEDIFALSLVVAQPTDNKNVLLTVYLDLGGAQFYWPAWDTNPAQIPVTLPSESVLMQHLILANLPDYFPTATGTINAFLWPDLGGGRPGTVIDHEQVSFTVWAPTPTPEPEFPCRRGSAVVSVWNIPAMNDGNKNDFNKQLLFCLRDEENKAFVGIYHRYVQPAWPNGQWWPAWRVESGADRCVEEWNIWQAGDLPWDTATFQIEWGPKYVTAKMLETGEEQSLHLRNTLALSLLGEDEVCGNWGWESPARAALDEIRCFESGPSGPCEY